MNRLTMEPSDLHVETQTPGRLGVRWWLQAIQVRLRFFAVFVVAGAVVSQWPNVRSVWDRWIWGLGGHAKANGVSADHEYFCPMDPGVLSTWPAICPICNMDLVPRRKMDAQMLPQGVIARMQFSPYRIQLAGIRTSVVEPKPLVDERLFTGAVRLDAQKRLSLEAALAPSEEEFFAQPLIAKVAPMNAVGQEASPIAAKTELLPIGAGPRRIKITLDSSVTLPEGAPVLARVILSAGGSGPGQSQTIRPAPLAIPESAVIDRGSQRIVFVESMPGQFDAVAVELGRRFGSYYPVLKGLQTGQRIASAGAFLIDAESRLDPSLAAGYFGANRTNDATSPLVPSKSKAPDSAAPKDPTPGPAASTKKTKLSPEEQRLVEKQKICPVTEAPLNSMGGPVPITLAGRKVFICCAGCENRLKQNPEKYLAKLATSKSDP